MQTNQFRAKPLLSGWYTKEVKFLCLNHPRARYQATRDHPYSPKPAEIIQTNQSSTLHPALPCLSCRNLHKISSLGFLPAPAFCLLTTWGFPMWPCMACYASLSRTCKYNELLFFWAFLVFSLWMHLTIHPIKKPGHIVLGVLASAIKQEKEINDV